MMVSNLSRAAAGGRVLLLLLSVFLSFFDLAAAAFLDSSPTRSQLPPRHQTRHQDDALITLTTSTTAATTPAATFPSNFTIPQNVLLNQPAEFSLTWPVEPVDGLALCQTNATDPSFFTVNNTWIVLSINFTFWNLPNVNVPDTSVPLPITFTAPEGSTNLDNFFFCWGLGHLWPNVSFTCESYSEAFEVTNDGATRRNKALERSGRRMAHPAREVNLLPRSVGMPTTPLLVSQTTAVLSISGSPLTPTPTSATTTPPFFASMVTVSASSPTTTITPSAATATGTSQAAAAAQSSPKLALGAIIGIAVGGAAIIIVVLALAFFCIRRRRRRSPPEAEHVLLETEVSNGSRDLLQGVHTEKDAAPAPMLNFLETRPASGFDHLFLSAPYAGPAAPTAPTVATAATASTSLTAPLVRQATVSTIHSERSVSAYSGPVSPRSTVRSGAFEEPYQDMPTYGDTRHTPRVYESASQTPFLSEPGMSEEELTRLEDEERRIDAAIAAAEGRR